jgi:hypothetical protein
MKLETVEFIMAVEAAFIIEIPDSKAELVISLGQLGKIVEAELGHLKRPKDAARVLSQISYIAAYFGGLERTRLGPETTLMEVIAGKNDGWNRAVENLEPRKAARGR